MLSVHWLANASNNLANIIEFIAERNAAAAAHLLDDIERATPVATASVLVSPGASRGHAGNRRAS